MKLKDKVAAIEPIVPFLELPEETWDRITDVNLKGTFLVASSRRRWRSRSLRMTSA